MTADAVGGVWRYALDLAAGLARHGAETVLALLGPAPAPDQRAEAAAIFGLRLIETGLPLDWMAASRDQVAATARHLAELAAANGADLVHLHSAALADARYPVPVIVTSHSCLATWWDAVESGPLPPGFAWQRDLVAAGLRAADAVLVPSAALAAATARVYRLATPSTVVANGREFPSSIQSGESAPYAFTAGRLWDRGKNLATLDAAAARLSIPVVAAGPLVGPNGAAFAPSHVRPVGRLDETGMQARLAERPTFVSLALYEPFGLAVLEAAGAGCGLVLSDIPSFRELWDGAALFVPPTNDAAAADAIEQLAADPALRTKLAAAARERAGRYTVDATVEGTLAAYRTCLSARTGGRAAA